MRLALGVLCALVPLVARAGEAGAAKGKAAADKKVKVVELRLQGDIGEQRSMESPFGQRTPLLRDFTASIRKAAKDADVAAILLRLNHPALGLAKLQELMDAIHELQASGKKVYCYLNACGNGDYLLAATADRVAAPPGGMVMLTGLAAQVTFFKGLLDWAGVEADLLHFGKHKSAGEPYTRKAMSEESRTVLNELLDDLYEQFVATIAKGRKLTPKKVRDAIDRGPYTTKEARTFGLIDDVAYEDQFLDAMGTDLGGEVELVKDYHNLGRKGPDLSQMNLFTFFTALKPKPDIPDTKRPKIVVIFASGPIMPGRSAFGPSNVVTAREIGEAFEKARKNDSVKAVVLRVDSPGGSALDSDLIWREVGRTRQAGKPVVASMSDVAGSGGYYIAMAADAIVAQPATITGSIGVIGGKLVLRGLYDKVGITCETFTRGQNAALFSDYAPFSEHERERVHALMGDIYNDFVTKAAAGRKMPIEKMRALATGRVWTARKAKELGLVDSLGGLKEAFELARKKVGLEGKDVQPVILPREKSFLEAIFGPAGPAAHAAPSVKGLPALAPMLRLLPYVQLVETLSREHVLAVMPYFVDVR